MQELKKSQEKLQKVRLGMEEGQEETVRLEEMQATSVLLREGGDHQGGNHPFPQPINPLKGKAFCKSGFGQSYGFRSISANPGPLVREDEDDGKDGILRHLRGQFQSYSKLGDRKSDGSHITMGQSDKWLKQVLAKISLPYLSSMANFRPGSLMEEF